MKSYSAFFHSKKEQAHHQCTHYTEEDGGCLSTLNEDIKDQYYQDARGTGATDTLGSKNDNTTLSHRQYEVILVVAPQQMNDRKREKSRNGKHKSSSMIRYGSSRPKTSLLADYKSVISKQEQAFERKIHEFNNGFQK